MQLTNCEPINGSTKSTYGGSAMSGYITTPTLQDPYHYAVGFGNRFVSEAVPDTLPKDGRNVPQRAENGLYIEQLNGTSFVTARKDMLNVWFHRIRPAVAHKPLKALSVSHDITARFSIQNDNVRFTPFSYEWGPLDTPPPSHPVSFWQGIKTMAGHGDPTNKEGLAVHQYAANVSMGNQAFVNHDGDFLIIPQKGRLDIQTESGRLMVMIGELCVIQAGLRFKVSLPDGYAHGYIQEIFGSHYELPDLGPVGSNGLALPQDFQVPVASYDLDDSPWEVILKLAGELYHYEQNHTPFDVVGWHGNYVPYKYAMEKLLSLTSSKDQLDPSAYTVLTAKSKINGVSLTDLCVFAPRWVHSLNAFRPPYYHRTMATEMMGMVYGKYAGSAKTLEPGALTCDNAYVAHGESYTAWLKGTTAELDPVLQGADSLSFMLHMSSHVGVTKFAMESHKYPKPPAEHFWDDLQGHFLDHTVVMNERLAKAGMPAIGQRA
ncbi:hypothetical protein B7463_g2152, partial [Scytalidium lignicola]